MTIFFIPYHKIGGAERVHLNIIKSLSRKPIVFFTNQHKSQNFGEFEELAYCLNINNDSKFKFVKILARILSRFTKLIVFGSNSRFFFEFIDVVRCAKTIDLTHAFSFPEIWLEKYSLNYLHRLDTRVVINQVTRDNFRVLYKENRVSLKFLDRISIIPNGIEIFPFDPNLIQTRFNNFKIGWVGRNSPEKRLNLFLEILKSNNYRGKIITDILSGTIDDEIEVTLNVSSPDKIRDEFSSISVLIVTSSREGFPLVVMEAMELGIPIISTDVGSIHEHVINGYNGYIYSNESSENYNSFVQGKLKNMVDDLLFYKEIANNARFHAEKHFDLKLTSTLYKEIFDEG